VNFNFSSQPEYDLNTSMITEVINLYGVLTKFLVTEKINKDDNVFGDYSHLKSDSSKIYDIYMLPETSEDWDTSANAFSSFGLSNFENITMFAAKADFDPISTDDPDFKYIIGNLILLPNNKLMEITDADVTTPGINNLFTYDNAKSVITLTCRPYEFKLINEVDSVDVSIDPVVPHETLDVYFQELIDNSQVQDEEAEVTPQVQTVTKTGSLDTKVQRPIIDRSEDDVFGSF
jgi:hypothetical protein